MVAKSCRWAAFISLILEESVAPSQVTSRAAFKLSYNWFWSSMYAFQ